MKFSYWLRELKGLLRLEQLRERGDGTMAPIWSGSLLHALERARQCLNKPGIDRAWLHARITDAEAPDDPGRLPRVRIAALQLVAWVAADGEMTTFVPDAKPMARRRRDAAGARKRAPPGAGCWRGVGLDATHSVPRDIAL